MQFVPLWTCILKSRKVGALPADIFRFWVFCLVSAQDHDHRRGTLPSLDDLAYSLHMELADVTPLMSQLVTRGFVTCRDGVHAIHDWQDWKVRVDPTAAERKRRERAKIGESGGNGSVTDVTDVTHVRDCHDVTRQQNRTESNRAESPPTPIPSPVLTKPFTDEEQALVTRAAERWGASNGDAVVGDLLREYPAAWVKLACEAEWDKHGLALNPRYLRGILQGYQREGGPPKGKSGAPPPGRDFDKWADKEARLIEQINAMPPTDDQAELMRRGQMMRDLHDRRDRERKRLQA